MRLSIIASFRLAISILTDEIIDSYDLNLSGMTLIALGTSLTNTTPLEASIKDFLLAFELILQLGNLKLLLLHQFLEAMFKFLFHYGLFFDCFGLPFFFLLF